ncbi:PREDICTED: uncharacterized protein LOC101298054 isoform 1 [Fragaria vesca subsp. vesca]
MGKLSFGKVLDTLCLSSGSSSCFCMNYSEEIQDEFEKSPLIPGEKDQFMRLKDVVAGKQTLAFQLKPKMVMLRVSMHCNGCARKVEKHISKMEGMSKSLMHTGFSLQLETELVLRFPMVVPVLIFCSLLQTLAYFLLLP